MIGWIRGKQREIERLTDAAAAAARESVWERTAARIHAMSAHEARGYARARARVSVSRAVAETLEQQSRLLPPAKRASVCAAALESVVDWVVQRRHTAAPAVVRRAA